MLSDLSTVRAAFYAPKCYFSKIIALFAPYDRPISGVYRGDANFPTLRRSAHGARFRIKNAPPSSDDASHHIGIRAKNRI